LHNIYASDNYIGTFVCYRFPKAALPTLLLVAKDFIHKRFCFIHKAVVCSVRKLRCWLKMRYLFCLKWDCLAPATRRPEGPDGNELKIAGEK